MRAIPQSCSVVITVGAARRAGGTRPARAWLERDRRGCAGTLAVLTLGGAHPQFPAAARRAASVAAGWVRIYGRPMAHDAPIETYQGSDLVPTFEHATVRDAMHLGVITCAPETPIATVARMMATHHVHSVMVLGIEHGPQEQLAWGIVSDLDLARAAFIDGELATAGHVAATPAVTVSADDPLAVAARLMSDYEVHHVVVTSRDEPRPIGILSTLDIAGVLAWGRA